MTARKEMTAKELFSIHGRIRRKHFVVVWLAAIALTVALMLTWYVTQIDEVLSLRLLIVAALVPSTIRRLHDMGYSGWLIIGVLLMPPALFFLVCLPGVPGPNAYGSDPKARVTAEGIAMGRG